MPTCSFAFVGKTSTDLDELQKKSGAPTQGTLMDLAVHYYDQARAALDEGLVTGVFNRATGKWRKLDMAAPADQKPSPYCLLMEIDDDAAARLREKLGTTDRIGPKMTDALYFYDQFCDAVNGDEDIALCSEKTNEITLISLEENDFGFLEDDAEDKSPAAPSPRPTLH